MIRIPIGNARSARVEVRSIAPDANPYLAIYTLFRTGLEGPLSDHLDPELVLPDNIYDAAEYFAKSTYVPWLIGETVHQRYYDVKMAQAERCPRRLGTRIKRSEIQFHHEVTNQYLWSQF
jgi:glutamine synthetase